MKCKFFVSLLACVVLVHTQALADGVPRLQVVEPTFDFGSVREGTKVSHQFELKNVGTAELEIKNILPGCGCTVAELAKKELAPGESTTILATFDTEGFRGKKVKTVQVYSNDPQNASTLLGFRGVIQADVEAVPPRVYFGKIQKGKRPTKTVFVGVDGAAGIKILGVTSKSEHVLVEVADAPKKDGLTRQSITVAIRESAPIGVLKSRVIVRTTSKRYPVLNIPVFARVEGDVVVAPSDISFGLLEEPIRKPRTVTLRIENHGTQPVRPLEVRANRNFLSTELVKIRDGFLYQLKVTLGEQARGSIRAGVTITLDHPDEAQRTLQVPVYAMVSRKGP